MSSYIHPYSPAYPQLHDEDRDSDEPMSPFVATLPPSVTRRRGTRGSRSVLFHDNLFQDSDSEDEYRENQERDEQEQQSIDFEITDEIVELVNSTRDRNIADQTDIEWVQYMTGRREFVYVNVNNYFWTLDRPEHFVPYGGIPEEEESSSNRLLPLPDSVIETLTTMDLTDSSMSVIQSIMDEGSGDGSVLCPICQNDFAIGETIMYLPCTHFLHKDCGRNALRVNGRRPICNDDTFKSFVGTKNLASLDSEH
jgi:Ring finger domain